MSELMVELTRGGYVESVHTGDVAVVSAKQGLVASYGDAGKKTFWRSAAKPIQALIPIITGAVDEYGITDDELALICASHFGEEVHTDAVRSILSKADVPEAALSCGTHYPFARSASNRLIMEGSKPSQVHHNCSGKHAGMLITCAKMGWPTEGYFRPDHPVQQAALDIIAEVAEVPRESIGVGVDGCSVSVFYLPLSAMARCYAKLADPAFMPPRYREAAARVTAAMMAHPHMVGGEGSFTTRAMEAYSGRLFAKNGAEGVFCLGIPEAGLGIALKIADGNDRAYQTAVIGMLDELGMAPDAGSDLPAVKEINNAKGDVVGWMRPAYRPGSFKGVSAWACTKG